MVGHFCLKKETNNYPIQKKYLQRISCQLTDFLILPFHSSSLIYTHILFSLKFPILCNLTYILYLKRQLKVAMVLHFDVEMHQNVDLVSLYERSLLLLTEIREGRLLEIRVIRIDFFKNVTLFTQDSY